MNSTVERLLYIALAVMFIGTAVLALTLLSFDHKLNLEVKQLKIISEQNKTTLSQVQQSNRTEIAYIRCIASLFTTNKRVTLIDLDTCQIVPVGTTTPAPSTPASPLAPVKSPAPSPSQTTPTSSPKPTPSPSPSPNALQRIITVLGL